MTDKSNLVREAIEGVNRNLEAAVQTKSARAIASFYTEDALLMPAKSEPIQGTRAIADFWETVLEMGISTIRIETREIDAHEATAIELGQYTLKNNDGDQIDRGKYMVIWKLIEGEWKLHRDIWNSSLPSE